MSNNFVWISGTATQIERAGDISQSTRYGWGLTFSGYQGATYWFHFAIPVIALGQPAKLEEVALLFNTNHCFVTAVHVFDGSKRIREFSGLSLSGDHSSAVSPGVNTWSLGNVELIFGLGVSVAVEFEQFGGGWHPPIALDVTFFGAGATFSGATSQSSSRRST